eukprot:187094_1
MLMRVDNPTELFASLSEDIQQQILTLPKSSDLILDHLDTLHEGKSNYDDIPDDVWHSTCDFLDIKSVLDLVTVCSRFNKLLRKYKRLYSNITLILGKPQRKKKQKQKTIIKIEPGLPHANAAQDDTHNKSTQDDSHDTDNKSMVIAQTKNGFHFVLVNREVNDRCEWLLRLVQSCTIKNINEINHIHKIKYLKNLKIKTFPVSPIQSNNTSLIQSLKRLECLDLNANVSAKYPNEWWKALKHLTRLECFRWVVGKSIGAKEISYGYVNTVLQQLSGSLRFLYLIADFRNITPPSQHSETDRDYIILPAHIQTVFIYDHGSSDTKIKISATSMMLLRLSMSLTPANIMGLEDTKFEGLEMRYWSDEEKALWVEKLNNKKINTRVFSGEGMTKRKKGRKSKSILIHSDIYVQSKPLKIENFGCYKWISQMNLSFPQI